MIQDLLDANRLRAGHRLTLDPQLCDVVGIASDVIADLSDAERQRVALDAPDRLEGVWAPDQLRRALWNLVTNALKYGAADGQVDVRLRSDGFEVVISIHNTGPAIPAAEQPRLFEPFGRGTGVGGRIRGWGLGLTLVRGCVDAHGGSFELSSTDEAGTTFTLRLPLDARPYQQDSVAGLA
jgi:signal transduction histidine kinase